MKVFISVGFVPTNDIYSMKLCFLLGCHNRETELWPHLDILKYGLVQDHILVYSGTHDIKNSIRIKEGNPGALLAFLYGLREAIKRKYDGVCYRNTDDWVFKQDLVYHRFKLLKTYDLIGYNWYNENSFDNITMNELYLRTDAYSNINIENLISHIYRNSGTNCEYFAASILRPDKKRFFRLSGRENAHGIGNSFAASENYRWFNKEWQLITSHNPIERWKHYNAIKSNIPYVDSLEKCENFSRWATVGNESCALIEKLISDGKTLLNDTKLYYLAEAVIKCRSLPGDFAEVGVYKGGSLKLIATLARNKKIHAFDTFSGTPINDVANGKTKKGDYECNEAEVKDYIGSSKVIYHTGIFPETATGEKFSFVHIDADTYQATSSAISYFWPRLVPGGQIVLDDYAWPDCPGVTQAILEKFKYHDIWIKPDSHQAVVIKKGYVPSRKIKMTIGLTKKRKPLYETV